MAQDFFGYNRTVGASNQLSSSEFAALTVGQRIMLCQNVSASYQQDVRPIYEVGNPSIFFVPGHASGNISFGRLAGEGSFFAQLRGNDCGKITPVSINSAGSACFAGSGALNFSGAIIQSVSLTMSSGAVEISETANLLVASMN
jgi:hypothetical protein